MRQWTALHYAAYNGFKKVCNLLLKWEADNDKLRDMKNSQDKKPIHICKNPETKEGFKRKFMHKLNIQTFGGPAEMENLIQSE